MMLEEHTASNDHNEAMVKCDHTSEHYKWIVPQHCSNVPLLSHYRDSRNSGSVTQQSTTDSHIKELQ